MNMSAGEREQYQVNECFKFTLPLSSKIVLPQAMAVMENRNARPEWGIDAMLIDEELLYLEDKEADRVYQELMEKSARRR